MIVTCPEPGRLRAWLDGESGGDAALLADHVAGCPSCRDVARELTRDAAVAADVLGPLSSPAGDDATTERALARLHRRAARRDGPAVAASLTSDTGAVASVGPAAGIATATNPTIGTDVAAGLAAPRPLMSPPGRPLVGQGTGDDATVARRPRATLPDEGPRTTETRRMPVGHHFRRWRLALGGLAAATALTFLVATPEGQAAASGFLAQFRTQRFAVVTFDSASAARGGLQRLERLGVLQRSPDGAAGPRGGQEVPTVEEASRRVGFAVAQPDPATMPAGVSRTPKITVAPAGQTRFTFDRDKAAAYFRDLGRTDLRLPDTLHGTTLVVSTPPMAMLRYAAADGKPAVMVGQTSDVQVAVEGAATLDEVRQYLLSVPGMPPEVADQLRAIQNWESTLPIPVPVDKIAWRETTIHGGQGLVLADNTGLGSAALWRQANGRIYGVAGPLKGDELQRVVDSVR